MKSGILLIDKEKGLTSRDVVNIISRKLNTRKVGHTGTLDPLATGLMIICVNKATGLVSLITDEDKEYIAKVRLGIKTDTYDITGNILEENKDYKINKEMLVKTLNSFIGEYNQEVPIYSAIKINGKKLYEYARSGQCVSLPRRRVNIKKITLIEMGDDYFIFKTLVSKGTYIRSLINDIGNKMNILMTMEELRRIKVDKFSIDDALKVEDVSLDKIILPSDFLDYKKVIMDDDLYKKVSNGVRLNNIYNEDYIMFYYNNELVAIYKNNEKNQLCLFKLF